MKQEQTLGLIRHAFTFGGGLLVARGKLDPTSVEVIGGAATTLIGALWSVFAPEKVNAPPARG